MTTGSSRWRQTRAAEVKAVQAQTLPVNRANRNDVSPSCLQYLWYYIDVSDQQTQTEWREHWDVALRFRQRGIEELRDGDDLVGSELMWGAAARATKAAASKLGMPHGSHRELFRVARRLAELSGITGLRELLGKASALHEHFYESHLPPHEITTSVASASDFVEAVGTVIGANGLTSGSP